MDRTLAKQIRSAILRQRDSVESVRFKNGEIHAYGAMPNTNQKGWYFFGYVQDVEIKGIGGIGLQTEEK